MEENEMSRDARIQHSEGTTLRSTPSRSNSAQPKNPLPLPEMEIENKDYFLRQSHSTESYRSEWFELAPFGFVILDNSGKVIDINSAACRLLNTKPATVIGQVLTTQLPKISQKTFQQHIDRVWQANEQGKPVSDCINLFSQGNGNSRVNIRSNKLKHFDNNSTQCLTAFIEANDTQELEEQLREQQDFSDSLLETAQCIVLVLDPGGNIVKVNRFFENLSGYTQSEIQGKNWMENFIPPDEIRRIQGVFDNAMNGSRTLGNVNAILLKDGTQRIIEWYDTQLKDHDGNLTGILALGQDITERVKAEEEVEETRVYKRLILNALPVLIARLDLDEKYIFANQTHDKWFPGANKSYTGKHIRDVMGLVVYEKLEPYLRTAMNGQQVTGELAVSIDDQEYMFVTNIIAVKDPAGHQNGVYLVMDDVTQFKIADANTMQYLAELAHESRINLVGQMMGEIAHEINQPLAAIANYAGAGISMHRTGKLQPDDLILILENIDNQVHRVSDIITHLRSFTQKRSVQFVKTNLRELVEHVFNLVAAEKNVRSIDLKFDNKEDNICIAADKILLEQVIVNLIRNSIEALSSMAERNASIHVSVTQSGSDVFLSVSDNGPGLSPEMIGQIFKPFFSTKSDSMGLGLSICQSIIDLHQGKLWVEQNKGPGVTFNIQLPVCPNS